MDVRNHSDVLVVGGGPVGLFTSLLLARHGLASTVVERWQAPLDAPKAHVINPRTLEIFRAAGIQDGVLRGQATRLADSRHVRFRASLAGREYGKVLFEQQDESAKALTPTPLLNLPQPKLERLLAELVRKQPLVQVRRGCTWRAVEQQDGLCVSSLSQDNVESAFTSRYVLACDGAGSSVRSALGVGMDGVEAVQSCLTIHFHANLRSVIGEATAMIYWTINTQIAGVLIAHDIDHNWVFLRFDALNAGAPSDRASHEEAQSMIRAAIGADVPFEVQRVVPWTMTAQVARQYRKGNVFLLGDAAHRFPPSGGLGMNTGLQDAHNLVWKLAAERAGWAGPALLDSYERERRGVAVANSDQSLSNMHTTPRLAMAMVAAAPYEHTELPADMAKEVVDAMEANAVTFDCTGLHLGFSYDPAHPLPPAPDVYVPRAAPGDRMPHAWLGDAANGRSVLDLLDDRRFTVIASGQSAGLDAEVQAAFAPLPTKSVNLDAEAGVPASWRALTGLDQPGWLVMRPDGHVLCLQVGVGAAPLAAAVTEARALCDFSMRT